MRREQFFGMRHIGVAIKLQRGARQLCAGMDTGMRQFIDEDEIVGPTSAGMMPVLAR
jgi:hypothetical protein